MVPENGDEELLEAVADGSSPSHVLSCTGLLEVRHVNFLKRFLGRAVVWAPSRTRISLISTASSLAMLCALLTLLADFPPLDIDDFSLESISSVENCSFRQEHNVTCATVIGTVLAQNPPLAFTRSAYFHASRAVVLMMLVNDLLRLWGIQMARDLADRALGFTTQRREECRMFLFVLLLLPAGHLLLMHGTSELVTSCCVARAKSSAMQKLLPRLVPVLLYSMSLVADAHNHGYFMLRLCDENRSAIMLLRLKCRGDLQQQLQDHTSHQQREMRNI